MGGGGLRELTRNQKTDAALHNEAVTRKRVDRLEDQVRLIYPFILPGDQAGEIRQKTLFEQMDPLRRGFLGRLRWLFLGR